jgi:DegV family protein with EDD domain
MKLELMMSEITIVTDSTANLSEDFINEFGIQVLPLKVIWGEESFDDNVDISPAEFYRRLQQDKVLPTTSQVTVGEFQTLFQRLHEDGKKILCIVLSSSISGTLASAETARDALPDAEIVLFDSKTTTVDLAFQVMLAARAVQRGDSLPECVKALMQDRQNSGVVFAVNTLEFLHRGGRIGGAKRFMGTILNIKPILTLVDGSVEALEQARTRRKSLARLVDIVDERVQGKPNLRLGVAHAQAKEEAVRLLEAASERLNPVDTIIAELSPVLGTHAGPGTLALAYHHE